MSRQITVFTSNGVGAPITVEHESERQARRVIKAAKEFLNSNGAWPPDTKQIDENPQWLFDTWKAIALGVQIEILEKLL